MKITHRLLLPVAALVASATLATAQDPNAPKPRPEGDRSRGFTMDEYRQRMAERLKTSMKVSDEEWAVLQPLIEKVNTKRMEAGGRGGFGGPGGPGGPGGAALGVRDGGGGGFGGPGGDRRGGDRPPGGAPSGGGTPGAGDQNRGGSPESQALRTALESESTPVEDLKAKLNAVREVRKKAAAEIEAARAELQKVVNVRQEAVLVAMGVLE